MINWFLIFGKSLLLNLNIPQNIKINIGMNNKVDRMYLPFKLDNKIRGTTLNVKTTKLVEKLPINENIWIKYSFDENIIEGINHGKPVNKIDLKYSKKDRQTIMNIIENFLSLTSSLARTHATPQKTANKHGKRTIAIGIK